MKLKTGTKVQLEKRDVTPQDMADRLYFSYFGGLTGTVDRIFDDGSVCVDVDLESLSPEARERHKQMQKAENERWLNSVSAEAKRKLTPEQKKLRISYKILVSHADLRPL